MLDVPVLGPDGDYYPLGDEEYQVYVIMLDRMSPELGDCYPHSRPFRLMEALMARFSFQICHERHKLNGELLACKVMNGGSMREHKAKYTGILQKLVDIGFPIPESQAVDTLLRSLPLYYYGFVACYNLMEVKKKVNEVFQMLMSAEMDIFVHAAVIAPIDKDKWHVHIRYKSYASY